MRFLFSGTAQLKIILDSSDIGLKQVTLESKIHQIDDIMPYNYRFGN